MTTNDTGLPPDANAVERRASVPVKGKARDRRKASDAIVLVLPLAFLLFAQWPLRSWLEAYSRDANNIAQIVFALYAAVAITAASRSKAHLAFVGYRKRVQRKATVLWRPWVRLVCVGPWAAFMLWTAVPQMVESIRVMEKFGEGYTAGYFVMRIALVVLAVLVLVNALADVYFETRRQRQAQV
nr:C4-dicarboxylate ABC transporter substrate-binding protein [Rhodoferax sp.]